MCRVAHSGLVSAASAGFDKISSRDRAASQGVAPSSSSPNPAMNSERRRVRRSCSRSSASYSSTILNRPMRAAKVVRSYRSDLRHRLIALEAELRAWVVTLIHDGQPARSVQSRIPTSPYPGDPAAASTSEGSAGYAYARTRYRWRVIETSGGASVRSKNALDGSGPAFVGACPSLRALVWRLLLMEKNEPELYESEDAPSAGEPSEDSDSARFRGVAVPTQPHPVFSRFPGWQGRLESGWAVNFLGAKTRVEFFSMYAQLGDFSQDRYEVTRAPVQNEEYFEWTDLLEAVASANGCFTMMELGAGWGRWLVSGALAARHLGLDYRLIGVEADPDHFRWMKRHFLDNDVDLKAARLVEAAVGAKDGSVWFHVGDSANWYGQRVADEPPTKVPRGIASRLKRDNQARRIRSVRAVSLGGLLAKEGRVDLIDADIQGSEAEVFEAAPDELRRSVRKVHIGTHSVENEQRLRAFFGELGWENGYDWPGGGYSDTPYGRMLFQDGVQSWSNPELD